MTSFSLLQRLEKIHRKTFAFRSIYVNTTDIRLATVGQEQRQTAFHYFTVIFNIFSKRNIKNLQQQNMSNIVQNYPYSNDDIQLFSVSSYMFRHQWLVSS